METPEASIPYLLALLALQEQAMRDWLTGLHNRRYFEETLADHIAAARRYDRPLSLVLFDIDGFKQINDTGGHAAGDGVLRRFAELLRQQARRSDIACRYGGDEFAVILPETGPAEARRFAERIAAAFADPVHALSVTAGIAALPRDDLVAAADAELMVRKRSRGTEGPSAADAGSVRS